MNRLILSLALLATTNVMAQSEDALLSGTLIGSPAMAPTSLANAFDNDNTTLFESSLGQLPVADRGGSTDVPDPNFGSFRNNWVPFAGLDLGTQHVITKVVLQTPVDAEPYNSQSMAVLGVFQGANNADFTDAVPLSIIKEMREDGHYEATVSCSKGFRYVRFVGSSEKGAITNMRCRISELAFFGHEGEGDDSHYYQLTNLPTVVINTTPDDPSQPWIVPQAWDKADDIVSNVIIIRNNTIDLQASATTRERGNNSRSYAKKPLRIKFDTKQKPMDATATAKKWTLINSGPDNSLMRNALAFEIARRAEMSYVPYCQTVDLIYNGEYKGTYQFCDQVELAAGRIEGDELKAKNTSLPELSGAYHCEIDYYANQEPVGTWFETNNIPITIKSPELEGEDGEDGPTVPEQYNYIKDYWTKALTAADQNTANRMDMVDGWRGFFDEDSWYRYAIVEEVVGNRDAATSIHTVKRRNDPRIYAACVWDHDKAFGNDKDFSGIYTGSSFTNGNSAGATAGIVRWITRENITNETSKYKTKVNQLWSYLRNKTGDNLSNESLAAWIEAKRTEFAQSADLNFKRWSLNDAIADEERSSYSDAVDHLKSWVLGRTTNMEKDDTGVMVYDNSVTTYPVPETYDVTDNLALYKHATATTYNNGFPPFMAIDGIENTVNNWWENSLPLIATDTEGVKLQNFTIDLGDTYKVNRVVVYWRDVRAGRAYDIQLSNDGEHYLTVATKTTEDVLPQPQGTIYKLGDHTLTNYYNARYVRVQGREPETMADGYNICEIMVYGKSDAEAQDIPAGASDAVVHDYDIPDVTKSLAYGKTAVATVVEGNNVPNNACDGNMGSRWATGSRREGMSEEDFNASNITIDLGDYHYITTIYTYWEAAYGRDYDLQVSEDGENFTTVEEVRGGTQTTMRHDLDSPMTGRYVRMQGITPSGGYGYSLWEMLVYGEPMQEVTVSDAGYATIVLTAAADLSKTALLAGDEEVKVFRVTGTDEIDNITHAMLTTDGVTEAPEGEAVVLMAPAGTYRLWRLHNNPAPLAGNLLKASDGSIAGDKSTIYGLARKNGNVGFYLVNMDVIVPAGKAYLQLSEPTPGGAKQYLAFAEMMLSEPTGITQTETEHQQSDVYYSLTGVATKHPRKGIYIRNGKKVIIRK